MNVNTSTPTQHAERFTGIVVSCAQIDAAELASHAAGQRISSLRVCDTRIGMASSFGHGFFCTYTFDGLYLGALHGVYGDPKNIVHWENLQARSDSPIYSVRRW